METELPEDNETETARSNIDWEERILCSDGNCIGVIGPDGHCKECGKKYGGHHLPEETSLEEDDFSEEDDLSEEDDMSPAPVEFNESDESPTEVAWEDRVLCSDGNCIGVIGPDGRCKECGKTYEG